MGVTGEAERWGSDGVRNHLGAILLALLLYVFREGVGEVAARRVADVPTLKAAAALLTKLALRRLCAT